MSETRFVSVTGFVETPSPSLKIDPFFISRANGPIVLLPNSATTQWGNRWTLYWADRNSRWHKYEDLEPIDEFDQLLQEVDEDHTGIF